MLSPHAHGGLAKKTMWLGWGKPSNPVLHCGSDYAAKVMVNLDETRTMRISGIGGRPIQARRSSTQPPHSACQNSAIEHEFLD
jgi:hypothetical protein